MLKEAQRRLLQPRGIMAIGANQGDELLVYNPVPGARKPEFWNACLPRQQGGENLSLADYFTTVESGVTDIVALEL